MRNNIPPNIPIIGQNPGDTPECPLELKMECQIGFVLIHFNPPAMRMKMTPRDARAWAVGLLQYADAAENPPKAPPVSPTEPTPPTGQ